MNNDDTEINCYNKKSRNKDIYYNFYHDTVKFRKNENNKQFSTNRYYK